MSTSLCPDCRCHDHTADCPASPEAHEPPAWAQRAYLQHWAAAVCDLSELAHACPFCPPGGCEHTRAALDALRALEPLRELDGRLADAGTPALGEEIPF